jgi:hypothetical protein
MVHEFVTVVETAKVAVAVLADAETGANTRPRATATAATIADFTCVYFTESLLRRNVASLMQHRRGG